MSSYHIGKIIGVMCITALCSYYNYKKWRERHSHDREAHLIGTTISVMIFAFLGGVFLGTPALMLSLWINKKLPVKGVSSETEKKAA